MIMVKFTALTCVFYIAISLAVQGILILVPFKPDVMVGVTGWRFWATFGLIWLVSFRIAMHFVFRTSAD